MRRSVTAIWIVMSLTATLMVFEVALSGADDDTKVKAGASRVETGARTIAGGVEETAKGIGQTVVEGAKLTGQKIHASAKAAEPEATRAGASLRDGVVAFGHSVTTFVRRMFGL